jgi:hypothetical protein
MRELQISEIQSVSGGDRRLDKVVVKGRRDSYGSDFGNLNIAAGGFAGAEPSFDRWNEERVLEKVTVTAPDPDLDPDLSGFSSGDFYAQVSVGAGGIAEVTACGGGFYIAGGASSGIAPLDAGGGWVNDCSVFEGFTLQVNAGVSPVASSSGAGFGAQSDVGVDVTYGIQAQIEQIPPPDNVQFVNDPHGDIDGVNILGLFAPDNGHSDNGTLGSQLHKTP